MSRPIQTGDRVLVVRDNYYVKNFGPSSQEPTPPKGTLLTVGTIRFLQPYFVFDYGDNSRWSGKVTRLDDVVLASKVLAAVFE